MRPGAPNAWLVLPFALVGGCATMSETRSETIVSREFHGTKLERTPELDRLTATARVEDGRLIVSALREESCLVSSTEAQVVDARIEQSPGGLGFAGELLCVAIAAPIAVVTLTRGDDATDPLGVGTTVTRGTGVIAAIGAAVCAGAAVYDIQRAKGREERVTREVPLLPTPAPCGKKPAPGATVIVRAPGFPDRTSLTDDRGEAVFDAALAGSIEVTLDGRTVTPAPIGK